MNEKVFYLHIGHKMENIMEKGPVSYIQSVCLFEL